MKKIISKLFAGALAAAVLVSGFNAFAFTDMKDTEASVLLSRLGIISGYEDGSFRPDSEVTRAEAAAIVVRAIGWTNDEDIVNYRNEMNKPSFHASGDVTVSKFDDYDTSHWANVYIQLGIDNGFISGFDDNTFRPEEKVTMAQLITMLTSAVGYDTYAQASGGYPNGYLMWAASMGITEGLGSFDNNKNATRGDVLACVRNAMDAPVCVISAYETAWDGTVVPMMETKDGTGRDFQSLLTSRHYVYTADAKVTDNGRTIKADLLSSINFDDKEVKEGDKLSVKISTNKNSSDDVKATGKYKMYIKVNDSDEKDYELVYAFAAE